MCLHYIILTIDDIPAKKIKFSEIRYSLCKPAIYYIIPIYNKSIKPQIIQGETITVVYSIILYRFKIKKR